MRVGESVQQGEREREREMIVWSGLLTKVPSNGIIGGGSFVRQRGQTVVALSPFLSHIKVSTAEQGRKEKKKRALERASMDCVCH